MSRVNYFNVSFVTLIIAIAVSPSLQAAPQGRQQIEPGMLPPGMGGPPGYGPAQQRQQGNYNNANSEIGRMLTEILETANQGGDLTREKQIEIRQLLQQQRQSRQSVDYQLLEAWSSFYAGDAKSAYRAAMMANRLDGTNPDAQATMVAMAMLSGSSEYVRTAMSKVNADTASRGALQLDASAIDASMLGQKIGPLAAVCMNSTKFVYPGKGTLCMLFWQLEQKVEPTPQAPGQPTPGEPNSVGTSGAKAQQRPANAGANRPQNNYPGMLPPGMLPPGMNGGGHGGPYGGGGYGGGYGRNQQPTGFAGEMAAFRELFMRYAGNSSVTFLGVNTDSLVNSPKVANRLLTEAWPWAQVMAEMPSAGLSKYAKVSVDPEKPTLVVTDERGQVKYAGPVSGFLPKMVMQSMQVQPLAFGAGVGTVEVDPALAAQLAQQMQAQGQSQQQNELFGKMMNAFGGSQQQGANNAQTNTNTWTQQKGDPNSRVDARAGAQAQAAGKSQAGSSQNASGQAQQLTIAQEYEAGKLLRQAEIQLGGTSPGSILRMSRKRSERGIEFCREILQKYPGTKFADEARNLLRKVPDRYKEEFNVTEEEIGR